MRHVLRFAVLYAMWLSWSGYFQPFLLTVGAVSCLAMVGLWHRMGQEPMPVVRVPAAMAYVLWLLWQVVRANFTVARIILSPRLPISPRLVRVSASQHTDFARVVHANSITLTPGTLSLHVYDDEIVVHALTEESARDVKAGAIDAWVSAVERVS